MGGGIFLTEGNRGSGINSSQKESREVQPLPKIKKYIKCMMLLLLLELIMFHCCME